MIATLPPFIDYSQYKLFTKCEAAWLERYINQVQREQLGQRDDAMTVGSLVHSGLQELRTNGTPTIPLTAVARYNPTPEAFGQANNILLGYLQAYPDEAAITGRYYCEEPLRFELPGPWQGLAKIDSYFKVEQITMLNDGLGGQLALTPGWWIHEYKTKDASRDIGNYVEGWSMNMQPQFQMLALQAKIGEAVQGVLVNVMERIKPYMPKRKCKHCQTQSEFRDWARKMDLEEGHYLCPACSHSQKLEVPEAKPLQAAKYYRLAVQKTPEQLELAKMEITTMARRMEALSPSTSRPWEMPVRATERCVDGIWGRCEYFLPHSTGHSAVGYPGYVPVEALAYVTA